MQKMEKNRHKTDALNPPEIYAKVAIPAFIY